MKAYPRCIGNWQLSCELADALGDFVCPYKNYCFDKTYMEYIPNSIAAQAKLIEEILPREPSLFVLKCWRKKRC